MAGRRSFMLGSLTDWVDGFLARKLNVESTAGKFMDPIADKLLVMGAILMLLAMNRVDPVMVFLLLGRDIFIGGVRGIAATQAVVIAAKPFGKWKTALQMMGIPCLLIYDPVLGLPLAKLGSICLWVSVVLSLVSGVQYTLGFFSGRAA
ncbi:MAG: CDP-diacylglycerol--glycerol-3-phosphate 3-phosphatidyltransferase [Bdellovibrionales bacterium]|nr:CDP-diacylglycerol--glycerol-3-phosphate 3-phosphatidyltransferase [Bdellovibrionales bacterium]